MQEKSRVLSVLCALAGLLALALTGTMNWLQGHYLGATEVGQLTYSWGAVIVDVAGLVVFGFVTGRLLSGGRWLYAAGAGLVVAMCAVWSVASLIGYGATERLSAAGARQDMIDQDRRADSLREKHLDWLRGSSVQRRASPETRREFLAAASAEIDKLGQGPREVRLLPDAQAELLAAMLGYSVAQVQTGLVVWLAFTLIVLKAAAFGFAGYLWPVRVRPPQSGQSDEDRDKSGGGAGGGPPPAGALPDAGEAQKKSPARVVPFARPMTTLEGRHHKWSRAETFAWCEAHVERHGSPPRQKEVAVISGRAKQVIHEWTADWAEDGYWWARAMLREGKGAKSGRRRAGLGNLVRPPTVSWVGA